MNSGRITFENTHRRLQGTTSLEAFLQGALASGASHSFGGSYLELVPNERIRHTDKFDDPNLPGEMQVTIELKPVFCGTDVTIVQEGVPAVIPAEACYLGWQESLTLLAQLVEPVIPG